MFVFDQPHCLRWFCICFACVLSFLTDRRHQFTLVPTMTRDDIPPPQEAIVDIHDGDSDFHTESLPSLELASTVGSTVELPSMPSLETASSYIDSSSDPEIVDVDTTMLALELVAESPPPLLSTSPDASPHPFSFPLTEFNVALLNGTNELPSEAVDTEIMHVNLVLGRPFVPLVDPTLLPQLIPNPVWDNAEVMAPLVIISPPVSVFSDHTSCTTGPLSHDEDSCFDEVATA